MPMHIHIFKLFYFKESFKYKTQLLFFMNEDRKVGRRKKIMVGFMALVLISSIFGVIFFGFQQGGVTTSLKYNDFKFYNKGNTWSTFIDKREALFSFYPTDVEFVFTELGIMDKLRNRVQIDVTLDINGTYLQSIALAHFQMKSTLGNFNIFVREGATSINKFNLPIINCEFATQSVPVIYFKEGNFTEIKSEGNCIIVEASSPNDFIRAKDRIVYGILGVIN